MLKFLFVLALVLLGVFVPEIEAKGGGGACASGTCSCYVRVDILISFCNGQINQDQLAAQAGASWSASACASKVQQDCTALASGAGGAGGSGSS
jgi:hypothetical protein